MTKIADFKISESDFGAADIRHPKHGGPAFSKYNLIWFVSVCIDMSLLDIMGGYVS